MILDFCPGGDLGHVLQSEGRFSELRSKIYIAEVLLALEELHKHDVIYRDLKPDNILLDADGHAMLTDFGLSKEQVPDHFTGAKSFCGSVAYLAPEMLKRAGHGKAVDWYLLGVVLYEMMVGVPPYYADSKEQLFENIEKAPLKVPNYFSEDLKSLIKEVGTVLQQLLRRNPTKRLGSGPTGAQEIKKHPWFSDLDWEVVQKRGLQPPPIRQKVRISKNIPQTLFAPERNLKNFDDWTFVEPSNN